MFYLKQYYSFTNQIQNKEKIKKEREGERKREREKKRGKDRNNGVKSCDCWTLPGNSG